MDYSFCSEQILVAKGNNQLHSAYKLVLQYERENIAKVIIFELLFSITLHPGVTEIQRLNSTQRNL